MSAPVSTATVSPELGGPREGDPAGRRRRAPLPDRGRDVDPAVHARRVGVVPVAVRREDVAVHGPDPAPGGGRRAAARPRASTRENEIRKRTHPTVGPGRAMPAPRSQNRYEELQRALLGRGPRAVELALAVPPVSSATTAAAARGFAHPDSTSRASASRASGSAAPSSRAAAGATTRTTSPRGGSPA